MQWQLHNTFFWNSVKSNFPIANSFGIVSHGSRGYFMTHPESICINLYQGDVKHMTAYF